MCHINRHQEARVKETPYLGMSSSLRCISPLSRQMLSMALWAARSTVPPGVSYTPLDFIPTNLLSTMSMRPMPLAPATYIHVLYVEHCVSICNMFRIVDVPLHLCLTHQTLTLLCIQSSSITYFNWIIPYFFQFNSFSFLTTFQTVQFWCLSVTNLYRPHLLLFHFIEEQQTEAQQVSHHIH